MWESSHRPENKKTKNKKNFFYRMPSVDIGWLLIYCTVRLGNVHSKNKNTKKEINLVWFRLTFPHVRILISNWLVINVYLW